jgi:hypothetical protein
MLFRSTGLGKTELTVKASSIARQGDWLVLHLETLEPVKWKLRVAMSLPDLWSIIKALLRWSNVKLMFSTKWKTAPEHPGDF